MSEVKEVRHLDVFKQFGKYGRSPRALSKATKLVVAYTRVSGKEQEKNMSLPYQRQVIDEYAEREGLTITAYFGGKFESAQTDGRKEFQRMLAFLKAHKGSVSQILVYATDRFSRTGGGAIKLAQELRDNYGVILNAISQPTDLTNPTGIFQQNIQFLFSHYDNTLRRQRVIAGMKFKFERGDWVVKPPQGYDTVKINGVRTIVINETGNKLRQAFQWKIEGIKNEEIVERLRAIGVNMYRQQLCKIFKNPFYAGLISHGMLQGKIVHGNHEGIITHEQFLKVNGIMSSSGHTGIYHKKEHEQLPLKTFIKCDMCKAPMTGYVVKKKNLWYYKCRTTGCKCNRNVTEIHTLFKDLLGQYTIRQELIEPLQYQLEYTYHEMNKGNVLHEKVLQKQLDETNKKIDTIEEKFYALNEMGKYSFEKLQSKYLTEKKGILVELERYAIKTISNLAELVQKVLGICGNLQEMWMLGTLSFRERLQKLVFPEGIYYDHQNKAFRTERVN
jgi:site-specific DNA recombinase